MKKKSHLIIYHVNDDIKIGDTVKIIDGSGLTIDNYKEDIYIVFPYPDLFNSEEQIKYLSFKVIETNVNTNVWVFPLINKAYMQDIVIEYNGVKLRTCSKFVKKV